MSKTLFFKSLFLLLFVVFGIPFFTGCSPSPLESARPAAKILVSDNGSFSSQINSGSPQFSLYPSGYKYSDFSRMFEKVASATYTATGKWTGQFAWLPYGDNKTNIYFYPSNNPGPTDYQETFQRRGDYIVLEGYSDKDVNGVHVYKTRTKAAYIFINGQWNDISSQFINGPIPYALENLPKTNYRLYVVYHYDHFLNGRNLNYDPNQFLSSVIWYVEYQAPAQATSVHFGSKLAIIQSEQYTRYRYDKFDDKNKIGYKEQSQAMCYKLSFGCWRNSGSFVDGAKHVWNW